LTKSIIFQDCFLTTNLFRPLNGEHDDKPLDSWGSYFQTIPTNLYLFSAPQEPVEEAAPPVTEEAPEEQDAERGTPGVLVNGR
jgi:hypothetical protein